MYDDLEAVLGEHADPDRADVEVLTKRFREYLAQLVAISGQCHFRHRGEAATAAGRAHIALGDVTPADFGLARSYLRRLALNTLGLLDVLDEDGG
ncbi:DUF6415 family natural product biosynthesis protein [Streptomyces syringium]|uniref:DUF6415 family natural product biosynthesis protein n=1 Tax=Streptomyces syringium TaxID=76729 RepID=UPI0034402597